MVTKEKIHMYCLLMCYYLLGSTLPFSCPIQESTSEIQVCESVVVIQHNLEFTYFLKRA